MFQQTLAQLHNDKIYEHEAMSHVKTHKTAYRQSILSKIKDNKNWATNDVTQ